MATQAALAYRNRTGYEKLCAHAHARNLKFDGKSTLASNEIKCAACPNGAETTECHGSRKNNIICRCICNSTCVMLMIIIMIVEMHDSSAAGDACLVFFFQFALLVSSDMQQGPIPAGERARERGREVSKKTTPHNKLPS